MVALLFTDEPLVPVARVTSDSVCDVSDAWSSDIPSMLPLQLLAPSWNTSLAASSPSTKASSSTFWSIQENSVSVFAGISMQSSGSTQGSGGGGGFRFFVVGAFREVGCSTGFLFPFVTPQVVTVFAKGGC